MYGYIYKTTNLVNNKIYIGQHKGDDFDHNYYGSGINLKKAINKYGISNFNCELLEFCCDKISLNDREKYWISFYESFKPSIGYNVSPGGEGGNTLQYLDEKHKKSRAIKISTSLKGHKLSDITRKKISESHKRLWKENYEELCMKNKKVRQRDDVRKAISDAQKERYNNNPQLNIDLSNRLKDNWNSEDYRNKQHSTRSSEAYKNLMHTRLSGKTSGYITINNGLQLKRVPREKLDEYIETGWILGRLPFSEEHKRNMSKSKKHSNIKSAAIKIRCVTTNEIFDSKKEAIDRFNLSGYKINKSLKSHTEVEGLLFELVDTEVD